MAQTDHHLFNEKLSPLDELVKSERLDQGSTTFMSVLRALPDAVMLVDARGQIVYWNEKATKLFDFDEKKTNHIIDLFPPEHRHKEDLISYWNRLDNENQIDDHETQLINKDEKIIDTLTAQTAIRDSEGNMIGYSLIVKDITSIKDNERRIARRTAQLLALNNVSEAITEISGVETLLERVLDGVLSVTSLSAGWVHLLEEEEEYLSLAAHRGLNDRAIVMLQRFELGEGITGITAVLGEVSLVKDTSSDDRLVRPVFTEQIGALITVPLVGRGGFVRGVLSLAHHSPRDFTEHEQSMLSSIGRQVGIALERTKFFDEATNARKEWEQTFDALTDGVSIHSPSGKIRRANRSLATMFDTTVDALVGIRCCELYHGSPKPRPDCTIMRTVTTRTGQSVELNDRVHGRILRVTTDPIIKLQGRVVGVVCTTRDITEEKVFERRLIQQERVSAIGELAAGIAHEVGTPLNIISANVELLIRNEASQADNEELDAIREQTRNITTLVRQLLNFARDSNPTFVSVNVNELIERTIGLLSPQLNKSNIKTELLFSPSPPTVDGDPVQLQQVLFNLINNARQAMESSTPVGKRILRLKTESILKPSKTFHRPHVVITVSDTGPGIPKEALPNVFKPFFTANKEGGTGLGLSISHRIVQKHEGLLVIEAQTVGGAIAQIILPLSQD